MDVPQLGILFGSQLSLVGRPKLDIQPCSVLKVEQIESQLAQLWDGFNMPLLIGAILNHRCDFRGPTYP